ncbi:MAG: glycosyltransferase family 4 protein [Bacteroidaceae bacterium]|nr:glycosyltransferase family 4 protein [Bacteroidaceae bacterium]
MNIAVVSGFNPTEFLDYLDYPEQVKSTGRLASSVHAIVRGFLNQGHNVTVISSNPGCSDELICYAGKQLRIILVQYKHGFMGIRVIPKMRRYIREHLDEFDVIHAHWTYSYAYTILPFVGKKPCFCSVRDWCPYLMTLPTPWSGKLNQWVNYYFFRSVMASKKMFKLANSYYTAEKIAEWYHTRSSQIIIPNPLNADIILEKHKYQPETPVFISIASLLTDPRKNIGTLLKAFNLFRKVYPHAVLHLVGTGSQQDFEYLSDSIDFFQGVTFWGKRTHKEVLDLIDHSSVLVHPALEETFGNIFLEAAARCIPSIGGEQAGAVPYVLGKGEAGCLCDVTSVESLYQAMKKLIEDSHYADRLVKKSMQNIRQKYAQDVVCNQHIEMYKSKSRL